MSEKYAIHWFRRDLRLHDNAALYHALRSGFSVRCIFIFDRNILDALEDRSDARVNFIHNELTAIDNELRAMGSSLHTYYGEAAQVWQQLAQDEQLATVFTNRDYEPYAQQRDKQIYDLLQSKGIPMRGFKDHVFFEKDEVVKDDGKPYTVFTPYSRKWKLKNNAFFEKSYPNEKYFHAFEKKRGGKAYSLEEMNFSKTAIPFPGKSVAKDILKNYEKNRDTPSLPGTSRLSLHLRFGTVSIRTLVRLARAESEKWLNELIWRDFYQMILFHFQESPQKAIKPAYDRIEWINDPMLFEKWCQGKTGYPIVDAGMRELNETGFMHNRVRMVVASFLTKHLLIDWRWGERYFAKKLLDFDLASNVGGWQWASGSGCDAAPYFRIFNPESQTQKFDPEYKYIRTWVKEFGTPLYPKPIVDHSFARNRCLSVYKAALGNNE